MTQHPALTNLTIALDKLNRKIEVEKALKRFTRHWTRNNIAADYDKLCFGKLNFFKNSLKRGKISVNVINCCDSHN